MSKIYSSFKIGGYIMAPYTFIRTIGVFPTVILAEVIAEYNYACKNNLDEFCGFLFDVARASKLLNLNFSFIIEQLNKLEDLGFLDIYPIGLSDSVFVNLYEDEIIGFKSEQDRQNFNNNWDDGLLTSLNPAHKELKFSESTLKIKHYFDSNANNPKSIPVLCYLLIESDIAKYEKISGNIFDNLPSLNDLLEKCALNKDTREGADELMYAIEHARCEAYKQL